MIEGIKMNEQNETLKISMDERDIHSYLDLEQYIIERGYLLNYQEFVTIMKISKQLKPKKIKFSKGKSDRYPREMVFGIVVLIFKDRFGKEFHCWSNVAHPSNDLPRKRTIKYNKEDITTKEIFYEYLKERNYLLNTKEIAVFDQIALKYSNWLRFKNDQYMQTYIGEYRSRDHMGKIISFYYSLKNQTAGIRECDFAGANIKYYDKLALERRRD